jgi:hypothetical protein
MRVWGSVSSQTAHEPRRIERAVTSNVYFDLTETFNAAGPIAILGSGQAVVFHRGESDADAE